MTGQASVREPSSPGGALDSEIYDHCGILAGLEHKRVLGRSLRGVSGPGPKPGDAEVGISRFPEASQTSQEHKEKMLRGGGWGDHA